ncbi:MATE family efflux transporter [Comamonadaceae bacterium OH2310_COT-174]|nr:MATE family efflux transporter [Comamonadaceae bacterium OH2310_COT-174]
MSELKSIARHTGVVFVGQLAVMAFGVTDTMVAGRHSAQALAALSVGTAIYISVYVGLMGVLQALLPIWAELQGARRHGEVGRSLRQALYLCAACIVLGMAVLLMPGPLLRAAQVPPALQAEAERYLAVLAWALPPALLFRLYSTLNQSLGHPRLVTLLQVGALLPKIALSVWLTFGGAGLPPQGAVGCAWATLLVNCGLLLVALWLLRTQGLYAPYAIWQRLERPDWRQLAAFVRLGVPAGLSVMVEVTSFTLMALFIARLGTLASASHQIAGNVAALLYMLPLALGIATSMRVSHWRGAGDAARARHAAGLGVGAAALLALLAAAALALAAGPVAALYVSDPAIAAATQGLLLWVAAYHLGDALQAVALFVLRSYRITVLPFVLYALLLWGLGLSGGYLLAFQGLGPWPAMQAPQAFWMTSATALLLVAALLCGLLWRVARADCSDNGAPRRSPAGP